MGDAEKDIEARMTEFEQLFNGDKLAEVATVFTSDTVVLPPGMGAQTGQEGAVNNMRGLKQMKGVETLTKDSTVVNQLSVDSACSHTNWTAVTKDGQKIKMKALTVWKKVDDKWVIWREMFNHGA